MGREKILKIKIKNCLTSIMDQYRLYDPAALARECKEAMDLDFELLLR